MKTVKRIKLVARQFAHERDSDASEDGYGSNHARGMLIEGNSASRLTSLLLR